MANIERLVMLRKVVANTPKKHFDLNSWAYSPAGFGKVGKKVKHETIMASCGAVGCAVGLAFSTKEFRDLGAYMEIEGEGKKGDVAYPVYGHLAGWSAVEAFFQIPMGDVYYLFDSDYYESSNDWGHKVTKKEFLERLDAYIAKGGR